MSKGPTKNEVRGKVIDALVLTSHTGEVGEEGIDIRIATYKNSEGQKVPIELLEENLCRRYTADRLADSILRYGRERMNKGASDHYLFGSADVKDITLQAIAGAIEVQEPAAFRFLGDNSLAFVALPFKPEAGESPTWDKLLGKMTSQKALRAFLGSLFIAESYRQQYLWVYGQGGDGKGCIGRWLGRLFGRSAVTLNDIDRGDKWLGAKIAQSRCVIVADFEKYGYTSNGHFKSLSGGDNIWVEEKFKNGYNVTPKFKFIFLSNQLPALSNKSADKRRAVICESTESGLAVEAGFEDRLWAESGPFMFKCLQDYSELCPDHGPVPFQDDELEAWTTQNDEVNETFFEECFARSADPNCFISVSELNRAVEIRWPTDKLSRDRFYGWLKSNGQKKGVKRVNDRVFKVYFGIVFNPAFSAMPYRPTHLVSGTQQRQPMPSDYEKAKKLSIVKPGGVTGVVGENAVQNKGSAVQAVGSDEKAAASVEKVDKVTTPFW